LVTSIINNYQKKSHVELETAIEQALTPSWKSKAIGRAIRHSLFPKPPAEILDLGAGSGMVVIEFAKRGYNAYGIEINKQRIREAIQNAETATGKIKFAQGNYLPKEFRARLQPAPNLFLNGKDAYKSLGKQPKDFDAFYIHPYPEQMDLILEFFRIYARQDAVLMALGDEADWRYNGEPQLTHLGTVTRSKRYTLYKK